MLLAVVPRHMNFSSVTLTVCLGDSCMSEWLNSLALSSYFMLHRCLAAKLANGLKVHVSRGF